MSPTTSTPVLRISLAIALTSQLHLRKRDNLHATTEELRNRSAESAGVISGMGASHCAMACLAWIASELASATSLSEGNHHTAEALERGASGLPGTLCVMRRHRGGCKNIALHANVVAEHRFTGGVAASAATTDVNHLHRLLRVA